MPSRSHHLKNLLILGYAFFYDDEFSQYIGNMEVGSKVEGKVAEDKLFEVVGYRVGWVAGNATEFFDGHVKINFLMIALFFLTFVLRVR